MLSDIPSREYLCLKNQTRDPMDASSLSFRNPNPGGSGRSLWLSFGPSVHHRPGSKGIRFVVIFSVSNFSFHSVFGCWFIKMLAVVIGGDGL